MWIKLLILLKIIKPEGQQKDNLTYKHSYFNQTENYGIDHHESIHTKSLQKSEYLCIESSLDKKFVNLNH